DGQVLTSHHVVKGAESVKVTRVSDGLVYDAQVLGYDSSTDIALLGLVGATGLTTARLGSSAGLRLRDEVLAIGNAGGTGEPTAVAGRISDLD
ncbi:trypsin-like peptidase domain-containing protein, partial [Nocardia farcinica]